MSSALLDATTGIPFPPRGDASTGAQLVEVVGGALSISGGGDASAANQAAEIAILQTMLNDSSPALMIGVTNVKTATFNRPANATAYAAGQLLANNTVAASVVAMTFTVAAANGGSGMVRKARIRKSGTNITNAGFRLHLFTVAPTVATTGDGGAFTNVSGLAGYVGAFDVTVDRQLGDGAVGTGAPHAGNEVNYVCAGGDTHLYGLLEVTAAYTPGNAETFNVDLEFIPNGIVP